MCDMSDPGTYMVRGQMDSRFVYAAIYIYGLGADMSDPGTYMVRG